MREVKLLRIVVASPGDVKPERDCVGEIVAELNRGVADLLGVRLDVVRWETDSFPGFDTGGSQAQIDRGLRVEDSDLVIGIFWQRFGTPVPDAKSGTEHEIRGAYRRWQQSGQPQIMVYFKEHAPAMLPPEEAAQWDAVRAFQKDPMFKEGLWSSYPDTPRFEKLVRSHLTQYLKHRITPVEGAVRTVETPLGAMDVSQPPVGQRRPLAEIAPGLRRHHNAGMGFEIGWPPEGWEAVENPFQLQQIQAQFQLAPTLTLGFVLVHQQAMAGFRPNVNVLAERVGPMSIRDYLTATTRAMHQAGQQVVSAEPDDATRTGVIVSYGVDPLGRRLFQFQRFLMLDGTCLIATASQLPPMDQLGVLLREQLTGILNSFQPV